MTKQILTIATYHKILVEENMRVIVAHVSTEKNESLWTVGYHKPLRVSSLLAIPYDSFWLTEKRMSHSEPGVIESWSSIEQNDHPSIGKMIHPVKWMTIHWIIEPMVIQWSFNLTH